MNLPQEGVSPNPSGIPGRSGLQPTAGAPAQGEAKQAESRTLGASASDVSGDQGRVPYDRFKQVNDELKGARAELERLRALSQQPAQRPTREGYEERIAEYERILEENFDRDPKQVKDALGRITDLRVQAGVNDALEEFFRSQAEEQTKQQIAASQADSVQRALKRFPELGDPESEFYQSVDVLLSNDRGLRGDPDGPYRAAIIVNDSRSSKRDAPPAFEGGRSQAVPTSPDSTYAEDRQRALNVARQGNTSALDSFLGKHLGSLVTRRDKLL